MAEVSSAALSSSVLREGRGAGTKVNGWVGEKWRVLVGREHHFLQIVVGALVVSASHVIFDRSFLFG